MRHVRENGGDWALNGDGQDSQAPARQVSKPASAKHHNDPGPPRQASTAEALLYTATWYCMSTILSIYNKKVLGKKYGLLKDPHFEGGFPAPLMMSAIQFVGQYLLAILGHALGARRTTDPNTPRSWHAYVTTVLPNGVATGLDIGFSNASLSIITLSFYTMCKSSAPLFLLLCAFLWRIETPTWGLAGIVVVISTGLVMLVDGEVEFNLLGFFLVMSAAAMSGVRWTITQVLLQGQPGGGDHHVARGTSLEVMEAVTPVMAATAAAMSLCAEPLYRIWEVSIYFSSLRYMALTFGMISLGSVFAFFMVLVEFVLIARTSALTFMVAGVFKEFLTVVVAHFVFGDELSWMNVFGLCVLVFGVVLFNVWKYDKLQREKAAALAAAIEGEGQGATGDDEQFLLARDGGSSKSAQELELSVSSRGTPASKHSGGNNTEEGANLLASPRSPR